MAEKPTPGDSKDLPLNTNEGSQEISSLVVCFGEMLIDFVPTVDGVSLAEAPGFYKAPGGAPANVAVGISRLGGSSAFIGKVSEEEISFLTGGDDPNDDDAVLKKLFHPNIKLLLVSEGSKGCSYYTKQFKGRVHGVEAKAVDTTGAGDAFVGGILYILASDVNLYQDEKRLREALLFANACGALTVTQKGAIPAMPTKEAVLQILREAAA